MLSNQQHQPARPMARRLLKHERQRSTPVVSTLQPESTSYFPEITYTQGITLQRQAPIGHRRGLSLDPSMRLQDLRLTPTRSPLGNNGMVSTNQGPVYQQQKMREAQMHGLSCPGHIDRELGNIMEDSSMINNTNANFASLNEADAAFAACFGSIMNAQGTQSAERSQSRPYTPINITMNALPSLYSVSQDINFTQSSPIRHGSIDFGPQNAPMMSRTGSFQGHAAMKRSQSQNSAPVPTTNTNTSRMPVFAPTPIQPLDFTNMVNLDFGSQGYQTGYESSNCSPAQSSPAGSSMRATPDLPPPLVLFDDFICGVPQLTASEAGSVPPSPTKSRSSSPRKKSAPLPEEMLIEETGITTEQVDAFIQGPDPNTNKYTCLFEGCNMKPFGRKENIRAHVQTHLGDRKYVCTVCNNRFVRPNDLKRHAVIHQEVKEYICKCGSAFGRQDALRRHRIRKPFCMDGDPTLELLRREEKKRGRPRKIAPSETNERRERKENIRKQVMEQKQKGSLPCSITSPGKSERSCSPEYLQQKDSRSPTNMSLTPPLSPANSPHSATIDHVHPPLESSVARLSLSPPPTRGSMSDSLSQEFGVDHDSPFGADHFVPYPVPVSPPHSSASLYGTPPELELSSSPPSSKFTMDFSDPEFPPSTTTSVHDFAALTTATNFDLEFMSNSVLMKDLLEESRNVTSNEPSKAEVMEAFERFLTFDSM